MLTFSLSCRICPTRGSHNVSSRARRGGSLGDLGGWRGSRRRCRGRSYSLSGRRFDRLGAGAQLGRCRPLQSLRASPRQTPRYQPHPQPARRAAFRRGGRTSQLPRGSSRGSCRPGPQSQASPCPSRAQRVPRADLVALFFTQEATPPCSIVGDSAARGGSSCSGQDAAAARVVAMPRRGMRRGAVASWRAIISRDAGPVCVMYVTASLRVTRNAVPCLSQYAAYRSS